MLLKKVLCFITVIALCLVPISCGNNTNNQQATLTVAAAADLIPAFEELGKLYEQKTGKKVVFSFGSTGLLAKQIENGAPMDVFAAANIEFIDKLEKQNLIVPGTKVLYARGRITVWTLPDAKIKVEKLEELTNPEIKKIAIANPEHAPYGMAAQEAMQLLKI
jgi:molybdate transport system substrate-binding protein